jgi:hypothetical protein
LGGQHGDKCEGNGEEDLFHTVLSLQGSMLHAELLVI